MIYPPHQMLTPEQQAKMDAQNAPPAKMTKREAIDDFAEIRRQFENGIHPLFARVDRYFRGE